MGSVLHEGRHGGDIARGTLTGKTYGVQDEVSSYRAEYSWDGAFKYPTFVDYSNKDNYSKLGGDWKTITNINQITPNVINNIVKNPGLLQEALYPPKDDRGNLIIPMVQWNNN